MFFRSGSALESHRLMYQAYYQLQDGTAAFSTRFGGVPIEIQVPVSAVVGIYSHENGQGTVFEHEEPEPTPTPPTGPKAVKIKTLDKSSAEPKSKGPKKTKPSLRVIK